MAYELLQAKGDMNLLGHTWIQQFMDRHPSIKSKFVSPIEKERTLPTDPATILRYLELYKNTVDQYDIDTEN